MRLGPWSPKVSDHGLAGVTRSGRWSPMISDHDERVSHAWIRGLPWSPTMSAMGPGGCHAIRVRGERQGPWPPMVFDHE